MNSCITQQSTPVEKIALFRSLFRGRDDVYAVRFESRKTGRSGYRSGCTVLYVMVSFKIDALTARVYRAHCRRGR